MSEWTELEKEIAEHETSLREARDALRVTEAKSSSEREAKGSISDRVARRLGILLGEHRLLERELSLLRERRDRLTPTGSGGGAGTTTIESSKVVIEPQRKPNGVHHALPR